MKSSDSPVELKMNDGWSQHHREMLEQEVAGLEERLAELAAQVGVLKDKLQGVAMRQAAVKSQLDTL